MPSLWKAAWNYPSRFKVVILFYPIIWLLEFHPTKYSCTRYKEIEKFWRMDWVYHLSLWLLASYLTHLCLSALICKLGIIIVPAYWNVERNGWLLWDSAKYAVSAVCVFAFLLLSFKKLSISTLKKSPSTRGRWMKLWCITKNRVVL